MLYDDDDADEADDPFKGTHTRFKHIRGLGV